MSSATIETTIARLRRCGSEAERIGDMLALEPSVVSCSLPRTIDEPDLSWVPTDALRHAGRRLIASVKRQDWRSEHAPWNEAFNSRDPVVLSSKYADDALFLAPDHVVRKGR